MSDPGYWITEGHLSPTECAALIAALSQPGVKRGRAGTRHLMARPEIATLASDPRLLGIAKETLGHSAVAYRATLFEKSGRANWLVSWHQDTVLPITNLVASREWAGQSMKAGVRYARAPARILERILGLRVHLDDSTFANGPLRVFPGSHRAGVLTEEAILDIARHQEPVECPVSQGGIMMMRPLLLHSSSKACVALPRRVLHIEYTGSMDLGEGIRLAIA